MAVNAAHFTTTYEAKPSIFEIIAQRSLSATLHPALERAIAFVASSNPEKLSWLEKYYEELFLVSNGLLQYYYLKSKNASFSEYFYGLQRTPNSSALSGKLTDSQRRWSLVFLIVFPYLKRKIQHKLEDYRIKNAEGTLRNNIEGNSKKIVLLSYGIFETMWGLCTLIQYLRYMSDRAQSQLLTLKLLNLKLVYSGEIEDVEGFWAALFKGQSSVLELSALLLNNGVRSILELFAFSLQFLQVWNAEKANYNFTALPTVPAPSLDNTATRYKGKCPLCLQPFKIPTVLPVSGYVFCFSCIVKHLREHSSCPVTNLPGKQLDLIRMYDTE